MDKFINYLRKNNYSKNTIVTYRNILKTYESHWHDIRNIRKELLKRISNPNTIWTHYNVLLSYMKYTNDSRIGSLKVLKLPPIPNVYQPVFSKQYLLNKTSDFSDYKQIIIRFLFETGLRASELKNIKEISKNTIVVIGKGNKTREIFHNNETTKYFKGFDLTTKTLRIWVKQVLGQKFTPHSIRRSHATHMLLRGANPKTVMLQLGHAKVETTYRYLQLSLKQNKKIYKKFY